MGILQSLGPYVYRYLWMAAYFDADLEEALDVAFVWAEAAPDSVPAVYRGGSISNLLDDSSHIIPRFDCRPIMYNLAVDHLQTTTLVKTGARNKFTVSRSDPGSNYRRWTS